VLLLYLLTTGLPLQFTSPLNLAGSHVTSPTILDWYGIRPPTEGWRSDRAIQLGDRLYWDSVPLAESTSLGGALRHNGLAVVAGERKLLVFPADDPDLVESIDLPESIQRIGLARDAVVLETAAGLRMMDPALLNVLMLEREPGPISWAALEPLQGDALASYQQRNRNSILTRERFFQDLHSGRAFGSAGEWLVNLASLAMLVLSFSGLMIWWRTR
jgi:hypothetical protein